MVLTIRAEDNCKECGLQLHEHNKERVYPNDGPAGSYRYEYICPPEAIEEKARVDGETE